MYRPSQQTGVVYFLLTFIVINGMELRLPAQGLTVLHTFPSTINGTNAEGAGPMAGLAPVGSVLCGTTVKGGRFGAGTIFSLGSDGSAFSAFRLFTNSPDAAFSQGDLIAAGGTFFGATTGGGSGGDGTLIAGQTNGSTAVISSFALLNADEATNSTGSGPGASLVVSGLTAYGTAHGGGFFGNGVIFSIGTNGSGFSVLHHFSVLDSVTGTNTDGAVPWGGLVLSGGTLYGTCSMGGANGAGTVFSMDTNGANFTTLYSFTAMDPATGTNLDGASPSGGLVLSGGRLYGTTSAGGSGGNGVIFSVDINGTGFTAIHHFSATDPVTGTNLDGANPFTSLALSGTNLYGAAPGGGTGGSGTVFSVDTNGTQFSTLYSFTAVNAANGTNSDGAYPVGRPLLLANSLYGTAFGGGSGAAGTVFKLSLPLAPAIISSIVRNPDGSITLSFLASPNSVNILQTTADLTSAIWQNISTNAADVNGSWQFTDTDTASSSLRFYRSYYAQ